MAPDTRTLLGIGPLLIGCMLNWCLFGCLVIQTHSYFRNFKDKDPTWLQIFIGSLFIIETVFTFLLAHNIWYGLVEWQGLSPYLQTTWSSTIVPGGTAVIASIVQFYFARRIWVMYSKSILGYCVAGVILMISLLQAGAGLGVSVSYVKLNRDPTYVLNLLRVSTVWLVSAMVCDWTITIALVLLLWNARNKTVLRRTSTTGLLDRLIISTVETGAVTSMASLLELVFFLRLPYTFLYTAVLFVIGRLYTNVLLASLNGRLRNQQIADNSHTIEISLSIRHLDRSSQSQDTSNQVHQKQQSKKSRRDIHSKRDHKHDQDSDKPTESRGDTIHDSMTSSASASASGTSGEKRLLRKGTGTRVTFDDLDVDDVSKNAKFLRTDYTDSLGVSSGSSSVYDAKGKGKESSVEVTSSYTESRTTGSRGMHSQSGG